VHQVGFIYKTYSSSFIGFRKGISGFQPREVWSTVVCKLTFCLCMIQVAEKKVLVYREFDLTIFEALTVVLLKIHVIMQCELENMNS